MSLHILYLAMVEMCVLISICRKNMHKSEKDAVDHAGVDEEVCYNNILILKVW